MFIKQQLDNSKEIVTMCFCPPTLVMSCELISCADLSTPELLMKHTEPTGIWTWISSTWCCCVFSCLPFSWPLHPFQGHEEGTGAYPSCIWVRQGWMRHHLIVELLKPNQTDFKIHGYEFVWDEVKRYRRNNKFFQF